jgi:hypothetical protein
MDSGLFERLEFRSIGPASSITAVDGIACNSAFDYTATASGGLFKTTNAGITWTPIFDHENTLSIGDIATATVKPPRSHWPSQWLTDFSYYHLTTKWS